MTIYTSKYEEDFISKDCIEEIRRQQKSILNLESRKFAEVILTKYDLKSRKDTNKGATQKQLLKTFNNLVNGAVSDFKGINFVDAKRNPDFTEEVRTENFFSEHCTFL